MTVGAKRDRLPLHSRSAVRRVRAAKRRRCTGSPTRTTTGHVGFVSGPIWHPPRRWAEARLAEVLTAMLGQGAASTASFRNHPFVSTNFGAIAASIGANRATDLNPPAERPSRLPI